jgi:8-amino-7-oxononanoate synthase
MDGDRAPLDVLAEVSADHDAWLMMDDAHGFGVLGGGRGSAFEFDPLPDIPLQMGTLSKAVGVYGAFLCASAPVIELMKNRARSLVYTTGLPPSVIAACIAAVDIISTDPGRVARPLALARAFCNAVGLDAPKSHVVPLIVGAETAALEASVALEEAGFLVTPIRPPTVPAGTSRLRFTFTAEHSEEQVAALAVAVNELEIDHGPALRTAVG